MDEATRLQAQCEAILSVAREGVSVAALAAAAGEGVTTTQVEEAIERLKARHEVEGSGLVLEQVAGGWRLATRAEHEEILRSYLGYRSRARLSQAALETLAIVAYRQPITLPEINFLRGVSSAGVVRTLLERQLIGVAGRKQVVGTPLLYRTTREFLVHFGLNDVSALPSLEEVAAVAGNGSDGA